MHSVEFLSIYGLRAESNEHIRNIKGPLNASVGGGFWRVEALKTAKSQVGVVGLLNTNKRRLLLNPRCLPLAWLFGLVWNPRCLAFVQGQCCIAWSGRYVLKTWDHSHPCLQAVAFSKRWKHLKWMKTKRLATRQQCEQGLSQTGVMRVVNDESVSYLHR